MSKSSVDVGSGLAEELADASQQDPQPNSLFGTRFMRGEKPVSASPVDGHTVLVVGGDSRVAEVLQAPESVGASGSTDLIDIPIDDLWPGEPEDRLLTHVRRALRSRQVQSAEYGQGSDDSFNDFVFIPYGRDRVIVVARDVSGRKTEFSRIERLAYVDDITKLPNRQYLIEELSRCTELLRLREGRAAVLCFDVSRADVEASRGSSCRHNAILVELAARMVHELRGVNSPEVDEYERYTVAARTEYGQFCVVLPAIESGSDAESVTQRLIDTLQQPIRLPNGDVKVTVRAGISLFPQDGTDSETLFDNAVAAMEDAKNNSAVPYKFHSGTVRMRALQRQDLQLELRKALDNDEFGVEFLPIVAAENREVRAVEALLRWPENAFGAQSIKKVISIAENTGLILPIGDWVLRKSCEALRQWHEKGRSNLRISVNMSVQEFSREDLPNRVSAILQEHAIDPRFLDIEITEYSLFRDAMKGYAMCSGLKQIGVGIVVDDYGTGACSLAHVARSPVDAIKIDQSFVSNAMHDVTDSAACAAIAAMAASLGKRIIAEGVETDELATMLTKHGCDELQGFGICRPGAIEEIDQFLGGDSGA